MCKNNSNVESQDGNIPCEGRYLIDALRAFLNDREPPRPPDGFDEGRFGRFVEEQRVVGIVFDELEKRPEYFSQRFMDVLEELRAKEVLRDSIFQATRARIDSLFEANGIRYLPLKGAIMKDLYPCSYQRSSADYDVLVDESEIQRARTLLKEKLGYHDESLSPQHYCLVNNSNLTTVELHYVYWGRLDAPVFPDPWIRALQVEDSRAQKTLQYRFTPDDFYLCMLLHIARHWLYYEATIRMFVDVWLFNKKRGEKIDRASLTEPLQNAGSLDFAQNVERACRVWFEGAESDETVEAMASRIFSSSKLEYGGELDPTKTRKKLFFRFIDAVLCSYYFKTHRIEYGRLPLGRRVLWIVSRWLELTWERVRRDGFFLRLCAFWSTRDNTQKRRANEKLFGLTKVSRVDP